MLNVFQDFEEYFYRQEERLIRMTRTSSSSDAALEPIKQKIETRK